MNWIKRINVYWLVAIFLGIVALASARETPLAEVVYQIGAPVAIAVGIGYVLNYLKLKRLRFPLAALISGLILGFTLEYGEDLWIIAVITAVAIMGNHFVRPQKRPLLNPAAVGLLVGMIIFNSYPSWWAGGTWYWLYYLWVPILLYKLKKWHVVVGYIVPILFLNGVSSLTSASLLFFVVIMLVEPKSSPNRVWQGLAYGALVAVIPTVLGGIIPYDTLIVALLVGNVFTRLTERMNFGRPKLASAPVTGTKPVLPGEAPVKPIVAADAP